jgi:hypothetical protein
MFIIAGLSVVAVESCGMVCKGCFSCLLVKVFDLPAQAHVLGFWMVRVYYTIAALQRIPAPNVGNQFS